MTHSYKTYKLKKRNLRDYIQYLIGYITSTKNLKLAPFKGPMFLSILCLSYTPIIIHLQS